MKRPQHRVGRRAFLAMGALGPVGLRYASAGTRSNSKTFFIDTEGDDSADGRSATSAWRSFGNLAGVSTDEPAVVLLRRGRTWLGGLELSLNRVVLGAYGTGARPVISGEVRLGMPVRIGASATANIWETECSDFPRQVLCNGRHLLQAASEEQVAEPGWWYWSDSRLVISIQSDEQPVLTRIAIDNGIDVRNCQEAKVDGIEVRQSVCGIEASGSLSCVVADSVVRGCWLYGVRASSDQRMFGFSLRDSWVFETGGSAVVFGGNMEKVEIVGNVVRRSALLTPETGADASLQWTSGIKNWGWGEAGWQRNVEITGNVVRECGPTFQRTSEMRSEQGNGIWIDEVVAPDGDYNVAYNAVSNCASRGIYIEKSDRIQVFYNLIMGCARAPGAGALALQANMYGYDISTHSPALIPRSCRNNRLTHNTVVGSSQGLEVYARDPNCWLIDNEVADNIFVSIDGGRISGASVNCVGGATNDEMNGAGNSYRNNCIGPDEARLLRWGDRETRRAEILDSISGGAFTGTIAEDPMLKDPVRGDIRLIYGSPCIDKATTVVAPRDFVGAGVPVGESADLGCLEYVGSPTGSWDAQLAEGSEP